MAEQAVSVGEGLHIDIVVDDAGQRALRRRFLCIFRGYVRCSTAIVALVATTYFQPATLEPRAEIKLRLRRLRILIGRLSGGDSGLLLLRR